MKTVLIVKKNSSAYIFCNLMHCLKNYRCTPQIPKKKEIGEFGFFWPGLFRQGIKEHMETIVFIHVQKLPRREVKP